jgi:ribose 1,5-bisphosphokinase
VSELPAISASRSAAIGPGRIVLVVGPSGAGKDTLLDLARGACADDGSIVFPRRVVTRQASQAEDNDELSLDAFRQALARGEFAMHWEAHGHCYGLPQRIEDDIRAGRTVVINVSRTMVEAIKRAYADVVVVSITAPPEILAERLKTRARGSDGQIQQRLSRAVDDAAAAPDVTIVNVGDAAVHARRLLEVIKDGGEA